MVKQYKIHNIMYLFLARMLTSWHTLTNVVNSLHFNYEVLFQCNMKRANKDYYEKHTYKKVFLHSNCQELLKSTLYTDHTPIKISQGG